jgi:hypothetical protein
MPKAEVMTTRNHLPRKTGLCQAARTTRVRRIAAFVRHLHCHYTPGQRVTSIKESLDYIRNNIGIRVMMAAVAALLLNFVYERFNDAR